MTLDMQRCAEVARAHDAAAFEELLRGRVCPVCLEVGALRVARVGRLLVLVCYHCDLSALGAAAPLTPAA